jgi:hypothetical protein
MNPFLWRRLGLGLLGFVALGLVWAGCRPGSGGQAARQEAAEPGPDVTEEMPGPERPDRAAQVLLWAISQRLKTTADLAAGRLTLFEAAAHFRAVQQVKAKYLPPVALPASGKTEEERLCWQVIRYVEAAMEDDPAQASVVSRLKNDLQEHLGRYGTVQLPASPRLPPPDL